MTNEGSLEPKWFCITSGNLFGYLENIQGWGQMKVLLTKMVLHHVWEPFWLFREHSSFSNHFGYLENIQGWGQMKVFFNQNGSASRLGTFLII